MLNVLLRETLTCGGQAFNPAINKSTAEVIFQSAPKIKKKERKTTTTKQNKTKKELS